MKTIFVYGTLKKGLRWNFLLGDSKCLGKGTITAQLYSLGSIPGITKGAGIVHGEVYEVSERTLGHIDELEQHPTWYKREPVFVELQNKDKICAQTYFWQDKVNSKDHIASGMWK